MAERFKVVSVTGFPIGTQHAGGALAASYSVLDTAVFHRQVVMYRLGWLRGKPYRRARSGALETRARSKAESYARYLNERVAAGRL